MRHITRLFWMLLVCLSANGAAQQMDWAALEYRFVGPYRGGRSTAVTGVEGRPNVFYFGATGGGLWKSEDYGASWTNVSDGWFASPSIGAVRVAPSDPNLVYVGTGSDGLRSNVISGKGVYKSVDGGKTWQHLGLERTGHIGALEIHPQNHNVVFVAAIGQAFAPNPERGVFRTRDGGRTWEKVLYLSDTTGFADLELLPSNPDIIFAAAWRAERKPWTIISGGKECGIYKSVDGGDSWTRLGQGLPKGIMGKIDLAVCRADSRVVYALVEAPGNEGGLYRSDDQGLTWRMVSDYKPLLHRPFYFCNVEVDPTDPDHVFVMALRLYESRDGGKTWRTIRTPHGDDHDLWINPDDPRIMIEANDGGANVTLDGGKTWSSQFNQPTAELYQVEVDEQYPYWLYAGQQDNYTAIAVPSLPPRSHQLGAGALVMDVGGCETGPAVPRPDDPDIVYVNCKGRFGVYHKRTGQEQHYDVGARYMYGHNPRDLKYRFQRVSPIHISPHDPDVVYHASQYVHRTTDGGKTWETISPDLTAFEPDKQVISGSPITRDITGEEFYSTIYSIRESKLQQGLIWVGANDGPVHLTRDGGKTWKNVSPKKLPPGGRVDCVEPSPHDPAKAYIAVLRYQLGDWRPWVFRTDDYGKHWTLLTDGTNGIPPDHPVRVVREDPERPGLLFAGTEYGMFVSFDDGASWQPFQQNLPVTPVTDIKIHRGDLVLSTMGRGFWILDDISALRQTFDPGKPFLFQPQKSWRWRYRRSRGTEAVRAPDFPPPSVIIDYYLPEKAARPLRLEILNARGEVVRVLEGESARTQTPGARDMQTGISEPVTTARGLDGSKGLHRFRWDMRHTGPWHPQPNRRWRGGPLVAPGTYTAHLVVDGQTLEQTFELAADPRVLAAGVSQEDMEAQEALCLKVVDLLSEARRLADRLDKERKALEAKADRTEAENARLDTLRHKLDLLVTPEGRYPRPRLIDQIGYLYGIISRADQRPGQDAYMRYEGAGTRAGGGEGVTGHAPVCRLCRFDHVRKQISRIISMRVQLSDVKCGERCGILCRPSLPAFS